MSRLLDKKHLPIKILSIEAEGFSYFQRQEIILHDEINILNGENGSGKTTFLNMLRLLFGAGRLDNDQFIRSFFERDDVHEIFILGRMDNALYLEVGQRPFEPIGKKEDVVTIVCRLIKEPNPRREYLIYDGLFDLDKNLKDHLRWLESGQYFKQMSAIGMSRSLVNAFSLNQGNTEKILDLNEEELANYLLNICGEQELMENFQEIKSKLRHQKEQFHQLMIQKQQEEYGIQRITQKIDRINKIDTYERQLYRLEFEKPLVEIRDQEIELNNLANELDEYKHQLDTLKARIKHDQLDLKEKNQFNQQLEERISRLEKAIESNYERSTQKHIEIQHINYEVAKLEEFLFQYEHIPPISLQQLEQQRVTIETEYRKCFGKYVRLDEEKVALEQDITEIQETGTITYSESVVKFKEWLEKEEIDYVLLAEAIEIMDEKYRNLIEGVLGDERFTILVPEDKLTSVLQRALEQRYPYWVSPFKNVTLSIKNQSLLSKLSMIDDRIGGYMQKYEKYMITQSIEEAMEVVSQGYEAVINYPFPYHVSDRGGRSLRSKGYYCGARAYEAQLEELQNKLAQLTLQWKKAIEEKTTAQDSLAEINDVIAEQHNVHKVPDYVKRRDQALVRRDERQKIYEDLQEQMIQLKGDEKRERQHYVEVQRTIERLSNSISNNKDDQSRVEKEQHKKETDFNSFQNKILQLRGRLSKEQKEFLANEDKLSSLKSISEYEVEIKICKDRISQEKDNGDPITPEDRDLPLLEEKYRVHEKILQDHKEEITKVQAELQRIESQHEEAQEEYMIMVEDVFLKVKRSLEEMSKLGNIEAYLRPIFLGEDRWKVDYRLGFNGKPPVSYQVKSNFSGGEKVIASLLFILAAIKSDGDLNFMLLDEPFAHLDRDRIQLAGQFLKSTGAQYIIAMPYTENVKLLMPWVDMSLNLRPKKSSYEMAPPITYGVVNDEYLKKHTIYKASS